ncbi:Shedu immune nuclease family protein [Sphingomonas faeni]
MSIFRGLAAVMPNGGEIVIGGDEDGSIPIVEFERLLSKFPTTTELNRYARARVADVVGQYVDGMADARRHYEEYMNRHKAIGATGSFDTEELLEAELAKYKLIRDTLRGWLAAAEVRVERDWQQLLMKFLLLIFPKYVAILENVQIADVYSTPGRARRRFIDIALVDAAGNLDVIEIKRPRGGLLAGGDYRENGFPSRELSGTIMQAEKYLFHLSKWGLYGERALTERYAAKLPPGMSIRVTNPKAIVILGRDPTGGVGGEQAVDLEVVRRKYANVMDIMSYDDLLRRLDNVIASLRRRIDEEADI